MSILAELRRRKPAQEDFQGLDTLMSDADAIKAEELLLEGKEPIGDLEVSEDITKFQPQQVMDRDLRSALVDAFVGGAPSLLGMIGGGSAAYNTMNLEKGSEYLKKRAQDEANQKLVQLKSVDGTPYLEKAKYAVGMEPYITPKVSLGGLDSKYYKPSQFVDTKTGRVFQGMFAGGKLVDISSGMPIDPTGVVNYEPPKFKEIENVKGDKSYFKVDPVMDTKKTVLGSQGLGSYYDVGTKGQAENIEKSQALAQKDIYEIQRSLGRLDEVEQTLSRTKDPRVMAANIYALARDYESKGILTDQDYKSILGIDMDTYLNRLQYAIDNKLTGQIEDYAKSFVQLARSAKSLKQRDLETIRGTIPSGGPKSQVKNIPLASVSPKPKPTAKNKAAFIQFEKMANDRIKDPGMRKKFLEQKRMELGL